MPVHELVSSDPPAIRLDHVKRLTDDTGILQHALYTTPDPHHGYTTDDNARALLVALQYSEVEDSSEGLELACRYLAFLRYAQRPDGRFHNFLAYDRTWLDESGSEDSHGRAVWSLGYAVRSGLPPGIRHSAETLLERSLPHLPAVRSPRAQAFSLLGLGWAVQAGYRKDELASLASLLADRLVEAWDRTADAEWPWFEEIIAYSNAKLCEGLLHAYVMLGEDRYLEVATQGLDSLISICFQGDMLDLVGQDGWYRRGQRRAVFDQQPVDAQSMVQACVAAYQVTGEERYLARANNAFAWFFGNNRLRQPLYDPTSGGCFDGLHPDRVNGNQGAESTLAYLLARLAFEVPALPAGAGRPLVTQIIASSVG